jgi:hypothetical protein
VASTEGKRRVSEWSPADFVRKAREAGLEEFVAWCKAPYLLLIANPVGEIRTAEDDRELTFLQTQTFVSEHAAPEPVLPHRATTGAQSSRYAALPIAPRLLQQLCIVVPLANGGVVAGTRVTVGRTSEQQVVINHRSVSKLHAYFDFDADRRIYLSDNNSTNHTSVNGTRILRPVEVHPGCELRFGSVDAALYRPQSLWDLFHP